MLFMVVKKWMDRCGTPRVTHEPNKVARSGGKEATTIISKLILMGLGIRGFGGKKKG
jgi:hypothetical protein